MTDGTLPRSNIFGLSSSASLPSDITFQPSDDDLKNPASLLAYTVRWHAQNQINKMTASSDWLSLAASAGQNDQGAKTFVATHVKPDDITADDVGTKKWTAPTVPTLPEFPTSKLPSYLDFDQDKIKGKLDEYFDTLQNKWIAKFLPAEKDLPAYDKLLNLVIDGQDEAAVKAQLLQLETDFKAIISEFESTVKTELKAQLDARKTDLLANVATVRADVTNARTLLNTGLATRVATLKATLDTTNAIRDTNLAARVAEVQPLIDDALAKAQDDTQAIAFTRARDEAAKEGARQENEAIADWAARGFALPGGVLVAAQTEARRATIDAATKIAVAEAIKRQEMEVDLAKVAVEAWLKITGFELDANTEAAKQTLDAWLRSTQLQVEADSKLAELEVDSWLKLSDFQLRASIDGVRTDLEANLRYSELHYQHERDRAKEAFEHLQLRLDFSKYTAEFTLKYRANAMDAMTNLINAYANAHRNNMDYVKVIADNKRQMMLSMIEYYKLSLSEAELGFKVASTNRENDLKWAATSGQFIGTAVGHHVQSAVAQLNAFAKIAGDAISGLNSIAQVTTTAASS